MSSTDGQGADFTHPQEQGGSTDEDATFGERDDQEPVAVSENTGEELPRSDRPSSHASTTTERGGVHGTETPVPESSDAHFADARDVDRLLGERHDQNEGQRNS